MLIHKLQMISETTGKLISWLTLFIVLITFSIVIMRYAFNSGSIAMQESVNYMYSLVFLIGIAYTFKYDEHVRVDIFYQKFTKKTKAWVNLGGCIFLLLPMVGFIFYTSWDYVLSSWELLEDSPDAGGLPFVYLLKSSILVFCILLLLEGFAKILISLNTILKNGHS